MRVGVIGCGQWGANHARTLARRGALAAVADRDQARAAALAGQLGCTALDPAVLIADPEITAVVVALPPTEHPAVALAVLGAGKHLFVEKPMALDAAGAGRIVAAARAAGLVGMTGHVMSFHPGIAALADLIAGGRLGIVRHVRAERAGYGRFHPQADVIWDLSLHDVAILIRLFGPEAVERLEVRAAPVLGADEADIAELVVALPGGALAHCHASRVAPARARRLTVTGTLATAVFDDLRDWPDKLVLHHHPPAAAAGRPPAPGFLPRAEPVVLPVELPLDAELDHFLACVQSGRQPGHAGLDEGLAVVRLLAAARMSGVTDSARESARATRAAGIERSGRQ